MSSAGFKPEFPPIRRLRGYALYRLVTAIITNFTDSIHVLGLFDMLTRVWQQLEYYIDVCRFTRGAHIEQL